MIINLFMDILRQLEKHNGFIIKFLLEICIYTGVSRLIMFCFIEHHKFFFFFFFFKFKVYGNPRSSKSISSSFPTFTHFMSLCYVLVILTIFQAFSLLLYFLWWSVVGDHWCNYCEKIMTGVPIMAQQKRV